MKKYQYAQLGFHFRYKVNLNRNESMEQSLIIYFYLKFPKTCAALKTTEILLQKTYFEFN